MGKQYRSREGDLTAVDTKTPLTTMGPDTAPGNIVVPKGATKLLGAICAMSGNGAATGCATCFGRLEGDGLPQPRNFVIGAQGGSVATGQNAKTPAHFVPIDSPVNVGNDILPFAEMAGADIGQINVGITLVFEVSD